VIAKGVSSFIRSSSCRPVTYRHVYHDSDMKVIQRLFNIIRRLFEVIWRLFEVIWRLLEVLLAIPTCFVEIESMKEQSIEQIRDG